MSRIAIIILTLFKLTARKQPQPSKKYKVIPNSLDKTVVLLILNNIVMELETLKANNNGKLPYGAISNIVASKAATQTWLTKPMVQYHLQKLNQAGKATNKLEQLPAPMTLNDSQSLAGHILSILP